MDSENSRNDWTRRTFLQTVGTGVATLTDVRGHLHRRRHEHGHQH